MSTPAPPSSATGLEPIAVVGLGCRYPGADGPDALWELLLGEHEALTRFTDAELATRGVPPALRRNPSYVPVGGVITGQDMFDPAPFGLGDAEVEVLDPQHRIFLECAWHALEDAGHAGGRDAGTVGVYCGAALSGYLLTNLGHRFDFSGGADPAGNLALHTANVADYLPLRVAHRMGFTGPAVGVGATCATSLVAVHLAAQALQAHECDTAIAGGVSLRVPQGLGYLHVPEGPFSRDGHTRPFAEGASGAVFTQGAGAVVLRRLSDARRTGDPVGAVLLGSAVGNDGADRVGFTAPSPGGQARTIAEALAVADVDPRRLSYVEGHGTATLLGDPIEVAALRRILGGGHRATVALGSIKGNIGHADSAAGVAGLIKTVLALRHGVLPASLHARRPRTDLELAGSTLRLVAEAQEWEPVHGARLAGVSSFGIGGVNCHVVLGEAPAAPGAVAADPRPQLLMVSAATAQACRATAVQVAAGLATTSDGLGIDPADAAYTLAVGRKALAHRAAAVCAPGTNPAAALPSAAVVAAPGVPPRVVFAFPGGDAQYAGMLRELYADEPVLAATVDRVSAALHRLTGEDPRAVLLGDGTAAQAAARAPQTGLPAAFTAGLALTDLLEHYGVRPDTVLGHSLGEYAAAVAAGILAADAAAELVAVRSVRFGELPAGSMLSVALGEDRAREVLARRPELDLAAVNADDACVLSGPAAGIAAAARELAAEGVPARVLPMDVAAHSRLVEPALPDLRAVAERLVAKPASVPLITTVTGQVLDAVDPEHWVRHLRCTVRFADALQTALAGGPAIVVQVGAGGMIASLAARHGREAVPAALTTVPAAADPAPCGRAAFLSALGDLWTHGIGVDLAAAHAAGRRRIRLPGYAFDRRHFWIDPPARRGDASGLAPAIGEPNAGEPNAAEPLQLPSWRRLIPVYDGPQAGSRWLVWGASATAEAVRARARDRGLDVVEGAAGPGAAQGLAGVVWVVDGNADGHPQDRVRATLLDAARLAGVLAGERPEPLSLLQVSAGGEQVVGDERVDPAVVAARGLPRVVGQEVPDVRWRTLDLTADAFGPARNDADAVLAEAADLAAADAAGAWEVALRGGRRWLRHWEPWRPADVPDPYPTRPDGAARTVVVTGGLGNVGLALARELCPHGVRVVLAGRSPEPAGATDPDPRRQRLRSTLRDLREAGAELRTAVVDVTDATAVADLLARVHEDWGRVDLLVHAPVVVELSPLAELDAGSADRSLAPKVAGAVALADAVDRLPEPVRPGTVLLMSSAAGGIGGFGLGPYVAASRFLDGVATAAQPGARWLAVDWDRWRFGTAQEADAVSEITMRHAVDAPDAVAALLRLARLTAAGQCPAQVAVSPAELNSRSVRLAARTVRAGGSGSNLASAAQRIVATVWQDTLGHPVTSADDDFFALGGHSLLATRVLATLRDEHGVELALRDLLARPTVATLAELMTLTAEPDPAPTGLVPPGRATGGPFPLTRVQHAYWIGRAGGFDLGGVGCHFYYEHDAHDLDVPRYEAAWNRVVARHEMLRAVVTAEGENLVLDEVPRYRIPVTDCRDSSPERRDEVLADLRARLAHRATPGDRWPLVEIHVVLLADGVARVALSVDVLVLDSASYLVVDRELATLYRDPDTELAPIGVTFAECVAALRERTATSAYRRAKDYWHSRLDTLPAAPELPTMPTDGGRAGQAPRFARRRAELDPARWRALRQRAADSGLTPTAALLAAYADVLALGSGQDRFGITLTIFDRPRIHPDVDRVVGEFSSLMLLEIDRDPRATPADRARAVQARLFEDLDHREYSGLEVLAEQARRTGTQRNVPVVFTGMLGLEELGGAEPHDHDWLGPVVYGVSQTPQTWLDHQVFELRDALVLQWDVNESVLDGAAVDTLFDTYVRWLTRLADAASAWNDPAAGAGDGVLAALAQVWADLLDLDTAQVTPDATFLTLGGDSLLAVRMAAEIRRRLGVGLALPEIRPTLTLLELAEVVRSRPDDTAARRGTTVRMRRRIDRESAFGLLPLQQAYFVGQYGGYDLSYASVHAYTDIRLRGVDPATAGAALDDAVRRVVAHQPMLRARLLPDGTQRILDAGDQSVHAPVRTLDLRDATPEQARRRLDTLREEMTVDGPDPTSRPGHDVRLTLLPGGEGRLHVSLSLLTCDGWSGAVFDREMFSYVADPNAVLAPLLVDFGDYVRAMDRVRETPQWRADHDWWAARLTDLPEAPPVPIVRDPADVETSMLGVHEFRLGAREWTALRAQCAPRNLTPASALAASYSEALARLTAVRRFLLTSLQVNRVPLHADVDRMIGPFSSTALLAVDLGSASTFTGMAAAVQAEVGDCLAHNLVSGVEVARELARLRGNHRPLAPVVFQSTLGLDAALGGDLPRTAGPLGELVISDYWQQVRTPQVWLECRVFELRDELVVNFAVVEELFGPGVIAGLVADVERRVRTLVDGSGWDVPVDLPQQRAAPPPRPVRRPAEPPVPGAPADDLERSVAAVWAQVLGPDACDPATVDRSSGFFELGGDSLLAIRMLTRLATDHGHIATPREFLADPTLAGLAAAVRRTGPGAAASPNSDSGIAVVLAQGSSADRPPLFLLHPSGGDVVCYSELAHRLTTGHRVVALADPALVGRPGPTGIGEMVRRYLAVIREHHRGGPYLLGGWSMGGTVAHQVAVALRAAGERVGLLVLVDSHSPDRIVALEDLDRPRTQDELWLRYLRSVAAFLDIEGAADGEGAAGMRRRLQRLGALGPDDSAARNRFAVFARHLDALARHAASPLGGDVPVLMVRTAHPSPSNARIGMGVDDAFDEPDLGWGPAIAGPLDRQVVEAHHYSLLRSPAVADVARHLDAALRRTGI